ncbi:hypothetical protein AGMMS49574_00090 [Bacteroidia bacterium]|nr:hypothetical protein AGMMS49574_00090 [Bacteroidia bacterium]
MAIAITGAGNSITCFANADACTAVTITITVAVAVTIAGGYADLKP